MTGIESMDRCFLRSRHELDAVLMIIIGTESNPCNWWISLHNGKTVRRLTSAVT